MIIWKVMKKRVLFTSPKNSSFKYMIYFNVLTPEQSLYKMLITLCLPQLRSKLECVRLLAEKTEELGEEIYYYAKHGRLVELAVLLLVARDKVTSASLVKNSSSLNEKDCRNLDHCMSLREFIVFELGQLSALEVKLEFHCENGKLLSCCKEKQNLMISALLLLEIFERAGKTIESYLKTQMPQEKIVQILEEAGFYLEDRDTDMSHVESFSWPSFLMMCSVPTIGKHAEKPNQLALGLHETYKKHNYVCSLPTLKYHREWLGFHTPLGTELHRPLQSSLQTLPMPQVCCVFGNQV